MSPEITFWIALIAMLIGLAGAILPALPGIALIWIAALIYAIAEGFTTLTPVAFGAITVLAAIGLVADFFITNAATKISGASWQATIAGVVGGIIGFVVGLFVGGIGAAPGGIIGALIGVIGVEYIHRQDLKAAVRAGGGWLAGCLASRAMQFILALVMVTIFVIQAGFRGVWG
jgi:uncharacterized protein YqgC (DUF456 family)